MNSLIRQFVVPKSFIQIRSNLMLNLNQANSFKTTAFSMVKLTQALNAEPLKAKKRVDPQQQQARDARKRKKLEREIKKLEKLGRKLKPIEEHEPDRKILKELDKRKRETVNYSQHELDDAFFLKKEWAKYLNEQHLFQMEQIERAMKSQEKALKELKKDDMNLYNKAIQLDAKLVPFQFDGPIATPPNKDYEPPEGDYEDVTYLYDRR